MVNKYGSSAYVFLLCSFVEANGHNGHNIYAHVCAVHSHTAMHLTQSRNNKKLSVLFIILFISECLLSCRLKFQPFLSPQSAFGALFGKTTTMTIEIFQVDENLLVC